MGDNKVHSLGQRKRPEDALSYLTEQLDQRELHGVLVVTIDKGDRRMMMKSFGTDFDNSDEAWIASVLLRYASAPAEER
jgi:hypothetical protein